MIIPDESELDHARQRPAPGRDSGPGWAALRRGVPGPAAFGLGSLKNCTNGKAPPSEFLIDFKSSEVGLLKTGSLQRSSVQPTIAFSESISNMNLSFCT